MDLDGLPPHYKKHAEAILMIITGLVSVVTGFSLLREALPKKKSNSVPPPGPTPGSVTDIRTDRHF